MRPRKKPRGRMEPFTAEHVVRIKIALTALERWRDLALFAVAIDTMLRMGDLLSLRVCDVVDEYGEIKDQITIEQEKTRVNVEGVLTSFAKEALSKYLSVSQKSSGEYLFTALRDVGDPITRQAARRLVKEFARLIHLDPSNYSGHSLRRSKAAYLYKATKNLEAIRLLLGHTSLEHTRRYLGVSSGEAKDIAKTHRMA